MNSIEINLNREENTQIIFCEDALAEVGHASMVFTDENLNRLYGEKIRAAFAGAPVYAMPAGEVHKTAETLFSLLSAMAEARLLRGDRLVCFGGGVVCDLGGLAAALYMRGIECVCVPTTLLAQVDAAVGGKTAVDFAGVKNLIGVIRQPARVVIDVGFLNTLPDREIRCGLGEMVKHAALNKELFDIFIKNKDKLHDLAFLSGLVPKNVAFKAGIVRRDAQEQGLRKCLNLGHTTAHAFELCGGELSHGEYVLVGLLFEAELATSRATYSRDYIAQLKELALCALGGMPPLPAAGTAVKLARMDKKNHADGCVVVTAPVRKGEYTLLKIPFVEYEWELARIQGELC
ncbi:MAG: 3-dehydroquinate synthase [Clostridia bacterium]|nr:3-dehydroquinate synthase [Clostridia bacterium]